MTWSDSTGHRGAIQDGSVHVVQKPLQTNGACASGADSAHSQLECHYIRDESALLALEHEWDDLCESIADCTVFMRHSWFDAVWQWRKFDSQLCVFCVRVGGRLVGVVPLCRSVRRGLGVFFRNLEFLSVPDSQECVPIVRPGFEVDVAHALLDRLAEDRAWDRLFVEKLPSDCNWTEWLVAGARERDMMCTVGRAGASFAVNLQCGWKAYYATRSRRLKKGNNYVRNRLVEAVGSPDIDWRGSCTGSGKFRESDLDDVIAVSAGSWKATTGLTLDNRGPQAFIRRLTKNAVKNDWLSVWLLKLRGETVAAEYQLVHQGVVSALRADFLDSHKELSPGTYLNWQLLEQLFGRGLVRYCMGHGDNAYKLRWSEVTTPLLDLTIYSSSRRGRLLGLWMGTIKPFLRDLKARIATALRVVKGKGATSSAGH